MNSKLREEIVRVMAKQIGCSEIVLATKEAQADVDEWIALFESYDSERVDRIEVIDDTGRAYVKGSIYGTPVKVELSYQDDGRTLKVFVTDIEQSNIKENE